MVVFVRKTANFQYIFTITRPIKLIFHSFQPIPHLSRKWEQNWEGGEVVCISLVGKKPVIFSNLIVFEKIESVGANFLNFSKSFQRNWLIFCTRYCFKNYTAYKSYTHNGIWNFYFTKIWLVVRSWSEIWYENGILKFWTFSINEMETWFLDEWCSYECHSYQILGFHPIY